MDFFRSFDADKLQLKFKLAETRIELTKNKKMNEIKKKKQEVVSLLRSNQEELAKIRTEHLVSDDFRLEVLGILGLLCALLKERTKLLANSKEIPFDMKESCATLVYAADRVSEIKELVDIKQQLMLKFKRELTAWLLTEETASENVNERVFKKLDVKPPNAFIVTSYMKFIAEEAGLDWKPSETAMDLRTDAPSSAPRGITVNPGAGSGIQAPYLVNDGHVSQLAHGMTTSSIHSVVALGGGKEDDGEFTVPKMFAAKPNPGFQPEQHVYEFNPRPAPPAVPPAGKSKFSSAPGQDSSARADVPDFDELMARFNALKRND